MAVVMSKLEASAAIMNPPGRPSVQKAACVRKLSPPLTVAHPPFPAGTGLPISMAVLGCAAWQEATRKPSADPACRPLQGFQCVSTAWAQGRGCLKLRRCCTGDLDLAMSTPGEAVVNPCLQTCQLTPNCACLMSMPGDGRVNKASNRAQGALKSEAAILMPGLMLQLMPCAVA